MSGIPLSPHLLLDRKRKRFLAFARNDDTGSDRASGARVLPYIARLRRSPSLSFIPLLPYPPLRGTFPSRGRLWCRGERCSHIAPLPPWERLRVPRIVTARLTLCKDKQKRRRGYPAPLGTLFSSRESAALILLMPFRIAAEGKTALPEVFLFADIAFDRPAIEESTDIEE